ncbi:MAG: LTA synthase family protein [Clostridiales Family XIII bacterium]|nr:LTA synthase family protein [Clostridiales Family XIII bacterium]
MKGQKRALQSAMCLIPIALLCVSVIGIPPELHLKEYLLSYGAHSDFIEENYFDPDDAEIVFPDTKRNLIYIVLESMESTYASKEIGGSYPDNIILNLAKLADDNTSFSNTDQLGGAIQRSPTRGNLAGTGWTVGGLVNEFMGLPLKTPDDMETSYGGDYALLPGAIALGDILLENAYTNEFLCGSDASFGGRREFFRDHGDYIIKDLLTAPADGIIEDGYKVWWGFEDEKLFKYAKKELTTLSTRNQPFNFTMLTADTHFEDGYVCRLCEDKYDSQYANVIACSDRQVAGFVSWVQQQDFYENTTIVIAGDHLTMDTNFFETYNLDKDYIQTVYNVIINPAPALIADDTTIYKKNRAFSAFDLFPTTLTAMGATFSGNRLGLGTDLFSGSPTIIEADGIEIVSAELPKKSDFYNERLLGKNDSTN